MKKLSNYNLLLLIGLFLFASLSIPAYAQTLDSTNYQILDSEIGGVGEISDSANYSISASFDPVTDPWFESSSYALQGGFPSGIIANVPIVNCFETDTDSGSTNCSYLPNGGGMLYECGNPGCYDKAKIEIDDQGNPVDTLYLVMLSDDDFATTYYLQSDHTIALTRDVNDYMTQCELEGRDDDDTSCDDSGDGLWDEDLQSYNILGLSQNTTYKVRVTALSGDLTESATSPDTALSTATTEIPSIIMDLDVASSDTETAAPYEIDWGELVAETVNTASERIWVDLETNWSEGISAYVNSANSGLASTSTSGLIPSESEDLSSDPNDNGGFGLRVENVSQSLLGPLQRSATYYNASFPQYVGAISATQTQIIYTDTGSGVGPIVGGRAEISLKARPDTTTPSATDYTDDITFVANVNP